MSTFAGLTPGLKGAAELVVAEQHTAPKVGSGRVHVLATPVGMRVAAKAELVKIDGRLLTFRVSATDAVELIGKGTHERVVVTPARFDQRVQKKAAQIP